MRLKDQPPEQDREGHSRPFKSRWSHLRLILTAASVLTVTIWPGLLTIASCPDRPKPAGGPRANVCLARRRGLFVLL